MILLHISSLLQAIRSTGDSLPHKAVYFSVIGLFLNTCDWFSMQGSIALDQNFLRFATAGVI